MQQKSLSNLLGLSLEDEYSIDIYIIKGGLTGFSLNGLSSFFSIKASSPHSIKIDGAKIALEHGLERQIANMAQHLKIKINQTS